MVRLYQDPEGKHIFNQEHPTGNVVPNSTVFAPDTAASGQEKNERVRSEIELPGRNEEATTIKV